MKINHFALAAMLLVLGQSPLNVHAEAVDTVEWTLPFELPLPGIPSPLPLNVTYLISLPADSHGLDQQLPIIFLMHGFNVAPQYYSRLIDDLTGRGYVVVAPNTEMPIPAGFKVPPPRPGCSAVVDLALPGTVGTFYNNLADAPVALEEWAADPTSLVFITHSQGGAGTMAALSGQCTSVTNLMSGLNCGGWQPLNATVRGAVNFEGFYTGDLEIPADIPILYLSGAFNNGSMEESRRTYGTCVGYVEFTDMNHFGINDYVEGSPDGQVTPCANPTSSDPKGWTTTEAVQNEGVDLIAATVDAAVRTEFAPDGLSEVLDSPRVAESAFNDLCT